MNTVVINLILLALVLVPIGLTMVLLGDAVERRKYNKYKDKHDKDT